MKQVYPWQQAQWQILQDARQQNRLPHAILLTGAEGLGKADFADLLAQSLLCEQPLAKGPCGQCRYCLLYIAGSHPDIKDIAPLEGKKVIAVDQVRSLANFMSLTSQYGQHKVVVIHPAEAMNINASNSLLKTLEEPSDKTVLILVSHQPAKLPATIRSRCQAIGFAAAPPEQAKSWLDEQLKDSSADIELVLALTDYAPLRAKELAQEGLLESRSELFQGFEELSRLLISPVALAKKSIDKGVNWSLLCLYFWSVDMVRLKSSAQPPRLANPDLVQNLTRLSMPVKLKHLMLLQDEIANARQDIAGHVNPTLVMESLFIKWQNCFRVAQRKKA